MSLPIYIGYDAREHVASKVLEFSLNRRTSKPLEISFLKHKGLRHQGYFSRKWRIDETGQLWDERDGAPCSTEFSYTRFLTPWLAKKEFNADWAVFMDCDILALGDIAELFALADDKYAVQVVKHVHEPSETSKMDGVMQTRYRRKNWSSVMLFNCNHPSTQKLTPEVVDSATGLSLHGFFWCKDEEIGALGSEWNFLDGVTKPGMRSPKLVHFTAKAPWFDQETPHAEKWFDEEKLFIHSCNSSAAMRGFR